MTKNVVGTYENEEDQIVNDLVFFYDVLSLRVLIFGLQMSFYL
ncbi:MULTISPECIES: hypothetical protein [Priestia]|jgi:hypothetical protein|nr:hypothetical protein [Priestia megaterium]MDY0940579.1 hypothetical protein [Priestia megaterium]